MSFSHKIWNIPGNVHLEYFGYLFQLPELRKQHDIAIMKTYMSKDLEIEELKLVVQKEWEEHGREAAPDLAPMTMADIHGEKTEQQLGRDTLLATQASLLKATGDIAISDDSQQHLLMSVSFFLF